MKSKLLIMPILSITFLFSGCGSTPDTETTTEVTTQQTTTTVETTSETTTITEQTTETETTTIEVTTEIETTTEDLTLKKQAAIEKDKEIWATVNLSQINTRLIQEATRLLVSGEGTYEELYNVAKQVKSNQESYFKTLYDLDSEDCADYIQASKLYVTNAKSVATDVIKAIDKNEPKYFQTAADSINNSDNYSLQVVTKRIEYLAKSGLNDEEIKSITSSNESTN